MIMSFLRRIVHFVTQPLRSVANAIPGGNIIVPALLSAIPGAGPVLSAAYVAGNAYSGGQSLGQSLLRGGASFAGNAIGSSIGGSLGNGSTIGSTLFDNLPGNALSNTILNSIPGSIANTGVGNAIGGAIGSNIATGLASNSFGGADSQPNSANTGIKAFSPQQEDEQNTPASISGLGSLTDQQKSTNLATQGVHGGGLGNDEQSYFLNLINRRLVDQSGHTTNDNLQPIEQSELQRLGLGNGNDPTSILQAISQWRQSQQAA